MGLNILRKFDTSTNLEADTDIINGEFCFATDLNQVAVKKIDGTWYYIGTDSVFDYETDYIYPITTTDTLKVLKQFSNTPLKWDTEYVFFECGLYNAVDDYSQMSLLSLSSSSELLFNCYINTDDDYVQSSSDYSAKISFSNENCKFYFSDDNTSNVITFGSHINFGKEDFEAYKLDSLEIKANGNTKIYFDGANSSISINTTSTSSGATRLYFGTGHQIDIKNFIDFTASGGYGLNTLLTGIKAAFYGDSGGLDTNYLIPVYDITT